MNYDAIVVGSGVSGMTSSLILRKEGMRLLVLEQDAGLGGLLRVFRRGGCVFPVGVHCLGSLGPKQILWRYFKYLDVFDRVKFVPMASDGFEEYFFPDLQFRVPCDAGEFRHQLIGRFPSEQLAIDMFFGDMRRVVGHFALYNLSPESEDAPTVQDTQSLQSYLDAMTNCRELKAILTAANPLYGVESADCPLYVHFLVLDSLLNSSWRVAESQTPLATGFEHALKNVGVDVRADARVVSIEETCGHVSGVKLANGETVSTEIVIFTGHPKRLNELCSGGSLRPAYTRRISEIPETLGLFGACFAWENDDSPFALTDVIVYNDMDTSRQYHQSGVLEGGGRPHMVFISGSARPINGMQSAVAMCALQVNELRTWWNSNTGSRPDSYYTAKHSLASRIVDILKARWPNHAKNMKVVDTFTSLTIRDYTLSPEGSAYGIKKQVGMLRSISPRTRIKGLFLAGQNIVLPGVLGTVISSVDVCGTIIGRHHLMGKILKETQ